MNRVRVRVQKIMNPTGSSRGWGVESVGSYPDSDPNLDPVGSGSENFVFTGIGSGSGSGKILLIGSARLVI